MRGLEYAIEGKSPLMHVLSEVVDPTDYDACCGERAGVLDESP
jgi:hypothetical protein